MYSRNSFFGCLCFSAYIIIFDLGTDIQIRPRSTYCPSQPLIIFFFNFFCDSSLATLFLWSCTREFLYQLPQHQAPLPS